MIKKLKIKKNTKKCASSIVFVIFFFFMFLIFAAFAVDGTIVLANRAELQYATEQTALAGASAFTYSTTATAADITTQVQTAATRAFFLLDKGDLKNAQIINATGSNSSTSDTTDTDVVVNTGRKMVAVHTQMISQPYFLSFFGVSGINLYADSYAQSEARSVTSSYGTTINWVSQSASYLSDILSATTNTTTNYRDTVILRPLGNSPTVNNSASYLTADATTPMLSLIDSADDRPLSLGPGGYITIKLPTPIIDKPGPDLYIREAGTALEGYFVFAGIDVNPYNPYVNADNKGSGISWINISCSASITGYGGSPEVPESGSPLNVNTSYNALTNSTVLSYQHKFYGSAYFDISDPCISPGRNVPNYVSLVKYIRIIDDNQETAFVSLPNDTAIPRHFYKTMLYGESSTSTAGADIDQVVVLNHVKLITSTQFNS